MSKKRRTLTKSAVLATCVAVIGAVQIATVSPAAAAGGCGKGYHAIDSATDKSDGSKITTTLYANLDKTRVWCAVTVRQGKLKNYKSLTWTNIWQVEESHWDDAMKKTSKSVKNYSSVHCIEVDAAAYIHKPEKDSGDVVTMVHLWTGALGKWCVSDLT